MPIDPELLTTRLLAFVEAVIPHVGIADLDQHIRFPVIATGAFRGSAIGRALWDSDAGHALQEYLLSDEELSQFHPRGSEFNLTEIRGRVSSLVIQALRSNDAVEFIRSNATGLADELSADPSGTTYWFLRGVTVADPGFSFGEWLQIIPVTDEAWQALGAQLPNGGLVVVPSDAHTLVIVRLTAQRQEVPSASSWVRTWPEVIIRRLAVAMWLASGVWPQRAVRGHVPHNKFPDLRGGQEFEEATQRAGPLPPNAPEELDPARLFDMFSLTQNDPWLDPNNGFDDSTARALRSTELMLTPALEFADAALVALAAYASMDGLLRYHDEDDNVVVPRIAHLLGGAVETRRKLRRRIDALYYIRSAMAHGERPSWQQVAVFLADRNINDEMDWVTENDARNKFKWALLSLSRCVWGTVLYLTGTCPSAAEAGIPRRTRDQLIALLSAAGRGDDQAQAELDRCVPQWLRDPLFVVD